MKKNRSRYHQQIERRRRLKARPRARERTRPITPDEHRRIIAGEGDPEHKAFYGLAWHLGASHHDIVFLRAEDVDGSKRVVSFVCCKTKEPVQIGFGDEVAAILDARPKNGLLFPRLARLISSERAAAFRQCCAAIGIRGIALHSYRLSLLVRARDKE